MFKIAKSQPHVAHTDHHYVNDLIQEGDKRWPQIVPASKCFKYNTFKKMKNREIRCNFGFSDEPFFFSFSFSSKLLTEFNLLCTFSVYFFFLVYVMIILS